MVSNSTIISMYITVFLSVAALVAPFLVIFITDHKKESGLWSSLGLGILGQFWSQHLLLIPVMYIFTLFGWFITIYEDNSYYLLYAFITSIILSLLTALGRLWSIWLTNRRTPSLYRALCAGIGFGGIKVLSLAVSYISYIGYCNEINSSGIEAFKTNISNAKPNLEAESIDNLVKQLTEADFFGVFMEGFNMIFLIAVEAALAVVIYEGLIRRKMWIATLIAAGINLVYTYLGTVIGALSSDRLGNVLDKGTSSIIYDAYMLACGLVSIWVIMKAIGRYKIVLAEGPYAHYAYFEKDAKKQNK